MACRDTWESTRASPEAQQRGDMGKKEPLLWFPQEGAGEAEQAGLELSSLNNFTRLRGGEAVLRWLVPGLAHLGQGNSGPEYGNPVQMVVRGMCFGLAGLHMIGTYESASPGKDSPS